MKRFLELMITFFTVALFLTLQPSAIQAQPIKTIDYIQNTKAETVILVSNSLFNGEITSYEEENNQNFSGNSPLILSFNSDKNLYTKNKTQLIGCFIHNLSTNNQKVQQIRAP